MEFQHPKRGAQIKVIGAGLPRTGTTSFCLAASILLNGPAYHMGMQYTQDETDAHIAPWVSAVKDWPYPKPEQRQKALQIIAQRLDGYVATADPPLTLLVPELLELYPDAVVVCTVRDKHRWADSLVSVSKNLNWTLLRIGFFLLPNMRDFVELQNKHSTRMHWTLFGREMWQREDILKTWDLHQDWLRDHVPKEKLFFVSVKDGWTPLCEALGVPVPDVPFPQTNDADAVDAIFKRLLLRGFTRWAVVFAVVGVAFGMIRWGFVSKSYTTRILWNAV